MTRSGRSGSCTTSLFTLNGTSLALILLAFSVAGLRAGLIRRWHGDARLRRRRGARHSSFTTPWHTDVEALGLIGLAGFLMWLVWIATYSVTLLRGERAPADSPDQRVPVGASA